MSGPTNGRVGLWLVGACGSVGVTTTVGALAVRAGLAGRVGLVAEQPEIAAAGLPSLDDLVIGGHDLRADPLLKIGRAHV